MSQPVLSVIIPAYNEQEFIGNTLQSIRAWMPKELQCEIFVVDHGSTDDTRSIVSANGGTVIDGKGQKTISGLRNLGIRAARGRYLLFLDSDTTLTSEWRDHIAEGLARLDAQPKLLLGSKRSIPDNASWVSRTWFRQSAQELEPTHLGGGHIIIQKKFVDEVGGFPEYLETGEDYEFCQIAKRHGGRIQADPRLKAVHNGVPKSLREFYRREKWHGRGDFLNLSTIRGSSVAQIAIAMPLLHLVVLLAASLGFGMVAAAAALGILVICAGSALAKLRPRGLLDLVRGTWLFYVYYGARALSGLQMLVNSEAKKVNRATR